MPYEMSDLRFWEIIREAQGGHADSAAPDRLEEILNPLSDEEVSEFGLKFYAKLCELNSWDLWAAGYVIAGGMSGDGFHYFRSWIVGKGERVFEIAKSKPDELGPFIEEEDVENESLEYVPIEILESRDLPDPRDRTNGSADAAPPGEPFDEDTVGERMPRLWEQFGEADLSIIPKDRPPTQTAFQPPAYVMQPTPPPQQSYRPPAPPERPKNPLQRLWSGFLALIAATWKFAYPVFKLAKSAKILLTMGTMFLSVWFYSLAFGWWFAFGFVVCILIHELGHVFAAWRLGLPISAPIFVPGMGAVILSKRMTESAWDGAIMGYGGPLFGTLAGFGCWGIYSMTGNALFLGLALIGFFMNLFNMIPAFPLDGGWITGAVSPYIWVAGLVGLMALYIVGFVRNPMIIILLILSLPRIITAFKRGTLDAPGVRTTPAQKATMGFAYVALCAVLAYGVAETTASTVAYRVSRSHSVVE